jgi:pimeloyl-ACP methyl ester carboxylesterase
MTLQGKAADPVVLIHGAWAGSWVWDRLVPYLETAELACHAIDLPGNGSDALDPAFVNFKNYLDHVYSVVGKLTGPVSLVAHSGGGNLASEFGECWPNLVSRIVYIAGIMLPNGTSFVDIVDRAIENHPDAVGVNPAIVYSPDGRVTHVPPEAAIAHFFNDCAADDAQAAAHRLTPQGEGGRAIVMRTTAERFGRIPRLYVEALNDKSVILPVQRLMQKLSPGARIVSLPTGHAPQFSAPDQLARVIIPFLRASRKALATEATPPAAE